MRLVLFVPQLCSGGAQQVAVLLSSALVSLGHEVHITAATLNGELLHRVNPACHLVELGKTKPIRARRELTCLINHIAPDAVICFGIYTGIAAALSSLTWKQRPVFIIRNENNLHTDWQQGTMLNRLIGPLLSRWAARRAHVVAVSRALAQPTIDYLHIEPDRLTTILNPVLDDTLPAAVVNDASPHPWLNDGAGPTFIAMGRLEHQKGFDILIEAFSCLRGNAANARLLIFGQGSLRESLQAQIDACGLRESATLAGHTNHPIVQMRAAHAFVLSSRFEGFGLVLVEALWAGTRVIATDCDYGPAEVLENGRYGTLVPVNAPEALSNAMVASLHDRNPVPRPTDTWFAQFTATEAARQHATLIESIMADRPPAVR